MLQDLQGKSDESECDHTPCAECGSSRECFDYCRMNNILKGKSDANTETSKTGN